MEIKEGGELQGRLENYEKCLREIDWMNQHATGVTFGENWPCDLNADEKARLFGLRMDPDVEQ